MIVVKTDRDANNLMSKVHNLLSLKKYYTFFNVGRTKVMDSQYIQRWYITEDVDRQWNSHNPGGKETIKWEDYKKMVTKIYIFFK